MMIGERLKELRIAAKMSQGDIEHKTGLLRCYISRVENGHTVPAVDTLEKLAAAMKVPMWKLFAPDGTKPERPTINMQRADSEKETPDFKKFVGCLARMTPEKRRLFLDLVGVVARKNRRRVKK